MAFSIRRADYFYTTIREEPGEATQLLHRLAELGVNLLAFAAVPTGPTRVQLTLFPEDPTQLATAARRAGFDLDGPYPALLVQGDDELGALARVHARLFEAGVDVYASMGVADGRGSYGYVVYIRPEEAEKAREALGL
jgi:hypothetical protein